MFFEGPIKMQEIELDGVVFLTPKEISLAITSLRLSPQDFQITPESLFCYEYLMNQDRVQAMVFDPDWKESDEEK